MRNGIRPWALLLALALAGVARAAEIEVLTAGAIKPLLQQLAPAFERETGHRLKLQNDTAGALQRRVMGGEAFDLLVVTLPGLQALATAGKVDAASVQPVARVGIGIAVAAGAPRPEIGSVEAFKQTLLAARSVALIDPAAGGSSGIYLAQLFERLGIAAEMKAKAVLVPGGLTATRLLDGQAELALQQITELHAVPGVQVLGPIPAELQNETVYAAGLSASTPRAEAARTLLAWLRGAKAQALLPALAMQAP